MAEQPVPVFRMMDDVLLTGTMETYSPGGDDDFRHRRQQTGFQDELALLDSNRALMISFWDNRKNAETYNTTRYSRRSWRSWVR